MDPPATRADEAEAERAEADIEPEVYDERRNVIARDKGLPGEVITGGEDPQPAEGLREERYYGRLLVAMVAILILGGFVIGLLIALAQA